MSAFEIERVLHNMLTTDYFWAECHRSPFKRSELTQSHVLTDTNRSQESVLLLLSNSQINPALVSQQSPSTNLQMYGDTPGWNTRLVQGEPFLSKAHWSSAPKRKLWDIQLRKTSPCISSHPTLPSESDTQSTDEYWGCSLIRYHNCLSHRILTQINMVCLHWWLIMYTGKEQWKSLVQCHKEDRTVIPNHIWICDGEICKGCPCLTSSSQEPWAKAQVLLDRKTSTHTCAKQAPVLHGTQESAYTTLLKNKKIPENTTTTTRSMNCFSHH